MLLLGMVLAFETPDFVRDVQPILSSRCFACHGPDAAAREGELRLDLREDALHSAIVPGDAAASMLIDRVRAGGSKRMPPVSHGAGLTEHEIGILEAWINDGATYQPHWAWSPLARDDGRSIDEHLAEGFAGLAPNAPATGGVVLRRTWLAVVGLPPPREVVLSFPDVPTDEEWSAAVDEVLHHEGFGEHWASMWLDLARYADTKGYEADRARTIWPWREWLVATLDTDPAFATLTEHMLAGDLLPEANAETRLATAFHRNTMTNDEGGTDDEEHRVAAVVDRVNTTMQVWMGFTASCAQCHDHKYDPMTQREYFALFDVFNQTADADRNDETPTIDVVSRSNSGADPVPVPVMEALSEDDRRETRVQIRGNYRDLGELVQAGFPEAFHSGPSAPSRLDLARWLCAPENPLTPRVQANRIWARMFGRGLVETEEDFGRQGTVPTHPELLDALAARWLSDEGRLRPFLKRLLMTDAWRRTSSATPEALAVDPRNERLARFPRVRLEPEVLRDQALAVSELLVRTKHGPPVYPPQPDGVWRSPYNDARWTNSTGDDRFRRSVYTYWKRTAPHPTMTLFDAPSREVCTSRRLATNTPLQALVGLNDPIFQEAALGFGRRIQGLSGDERDQLVQAFRLLTGREPSLPEVQRLQDTLHQARRHYADRPEEAAAFLAAFAEARRVKVGRDISAEEESAWALVASVLLNLDEVLCRG
ncbi:MAG: PSD1 and planctomycete cytochrome C domain-containing protein [Planctomycetota bacterium]